MYSLQLPIGRKKRKMEGIPKKNANVLRDYKRRPERRPPSKKNAAAGGLKTKSQDGRGVGLR